MKKKLASTIKDKINFSPLFLHFLEPTVPQVKKEKKEPLVKKPPRKSKLPEPVTKSRQQNVTENATTTMTTTATTTATTPTNTRRYKKNGEEES